MQKRTASSSSSSSSSDHATAAALLRGGSHSFFAASLLLPARIAHPAAALYAFCRIADDEIDFGADKPAALTRLTARLHAIYRTTPEPTPVDRAFAAMVAAHNIPSALPFALLEGLAWDAEFRRYQTLDELLAYAARVAGSVGVMMARVMGVRDAATLSRAADLGIAMQLTNIARDIGEDARAGRLFIPLDWLRDAGVDAETFLAAPHFTPAIAGLTQRLLATAAPLYASGRQGIRHLPRRCRPAIAAAARIYAAIGGQIAANRYNSINHRAYVPTAAKLRLATMALADALIPAAASPPTVLPQIEFLLAAIPHTPRIGSVDRVLDIFERLERAQRRLA